MPRYIETMDDAPDDIIKKGKTIASIEYGTVASPSVPNPIRTSTEGEFDNSTSSPGQITGPYEEIEASSSAPEILEDNDAPMPRYIETMDDAPDDIIKKGKTIASIEYGTVASPSVHNPIRTSTLEVDAAVNHDNGPPDQSSSARPWAEDGIVVRPTRETMRPVDGIAHGSDAAAAAAAADPIIPGNQQPSIDRDMSESSTMAIIHNQSDQPGSGSAVSPHTIPSTTATVNVPVENTQNEVSASPFLDLHNVQATAVDNHVYDAVFVPNVPTEENATEQEESWLKRNQKCIFALLILIIGILGGMVGTLLAFRGGNSNANGSDGSNELDSNDRLGGPTRGPASTSPSSSVSMHPSSVLLRGESDGPKPLFSDAPTDYPSLVQSQLPSQSGTPTDYPSMVQSQLPTNSPAGSICLLVTTGSGTYSDGTVDIFINEENRSGYVNANTPGKYYSHGDVVVDLCFDDIPGVQIRNQGTDGWAGSIELSLDGGVSYFPMVCTDCSGTTDFSPINADGDPESANMMATTLCVDGSTCTLAPAKSLWLQVGKTIKGKVDGELFGEPVKISGDGMILAISAIKNDDNGNDSGQVTLYRWEESSSNYEQLGEAINGSAPGDKIGTSSYGSSLALSLDGKTLAIGSRYHDANGSGSGHVRIFTLDNDTVSFRQELIGETANAGFGWASTLSHDGTTLAVSIRGSGIINVYRRKDASSDYEILGEGSIKVSVGNNRFGQSLTMSAEGDTLAVGDPWIQSNGNENVGLVKVYHLDDTNLKWKQLGEDLAGKNANDFFGWSIDLSEEGRVLAISAALSGEDSKQFGHVSIYELAEEGWAQRGRDLIGRYGDHQGESVSLSAHGKTVAIGSTFNDDNGANSGRAMVYQWCEIELDYKQVENYLSGEAAGDLFGVSVDISADAMTLVVGSPANKEGYAKVYKYKYENSMVVWNQIGQTFMGEASGDGFGGVVRLSGDALILAISAGRNDDNGEDSGQIVLYKWNDDSSSYNQLGEAINGAAAGDELGRPGSGDVPLDLSLDGKYVAVGGKYHSGNNGIHSGHVRIFILGSDRSELKELIQEFFGENANDYFGSSVSLSEDGNVLAIAAPGDGPGTVKVFSRGDESSEYKQLGRSIVGDEEGDQFGKSLFLSANGLTLAIGSPFAKSGLVRVFRLDDIDNEWKQVGEDFIGNGDYFGFSVALSRQGNVLAISAPLGDKGGQEATTNEGIVKI